MALNQNDMNAQKLLNATNQLVEQLKVTQSTKKDMDIDDIVDDLEIIGYKLNKKSVSRYIWQLFNLVVKRVKSWKITSEPDVRFELEFELGDNDLIF